MKRSFLAICTALAVGLFAPLSGGCAGLVTPPSAPDDPVDIYLLDHGPHTSLALPRQAGGMVRYSYCDWRWCVQGRRHLLSGTAALLWPTASGLGRGQHPDVSSLEELDKLAPEGLARVYALQADATQAKALIQHLDGYFMEEAPNAAYSEEFAMEFVPYPRGYWLAHQSNLVIAQWLREMGFQVRSFPLLLTWRIDTREEDD